MKFNLLFFLLFLSWECFSQHNIKIDAEISSYKSEIRNSTDLTNWALKLNNRSNKYFKFKRYATVGSKFQYLVDIGYEIKYTDSIGKSSVDTCYLLVANSFVNDDELERIFPGQYKHFIIDIPPYCACKKGLYEIRLVVFVNNYNPKLEPVVSNSIIVVVPSTFDPYKGPPFN